MTEDTTNSKTLQQKIDDYARLTAKKARDICRRHNVPTEVADAMAADAVDMLHGDYQGLRATTEQMGVLSAQVQQRSWERTCNAALCFIATYYREIYNNKTAPAIVSVEDVITCEICARRGVEVDERVAATARNTYRIYATLIIGENTDATADELRTMLPDELPEANKNRLIVVAMHARRVAQHLNYKAQQKRAAKKQAKDAGGTLFGGDSSKTMAIYSNLANEIAKGLKTADQDTPNKLRPLRQAIDEQRSASAAVLEDTTATDEQRAQAAMFITNTNSVSLVFDGVHAMLNARNLRAPDSADTRYIRYDMTPHEFAKYCTGHPHPNTDTISGVLSAVAWLRTQSITITETGEKWITERKDGKVVYDEHGKPKKKYVQYTKKTNFQPVIAEFQAEQRSDTLTPNTTRVSIYIHDIIANGRSGDYYIDDSDGHKQRLHIKKPQQLYLTQAQFYAANSEEERRLRYLLMTCDRLTEDKLLARIFDYDARRQSYKEEADKAQAVADAMGNSPDATDEQKQAAKKQAADALYKAKYYITNHMGNDVERLRQMFDTFKRCELIKDYDRRLPAHDTSKKKYGAAVWTWHRPTAGDLNGKKQRGRG